MNNKSMTPPPPLDRRVNLLDIVLMLSMILGVGASFIWLSRKMSITIMLLAGIWGVDLYLKILVGQGSSTAFADLSFTSFVFVVSRGVSLISEEPLTGSEQNYLINIVIISFILGVIWLCNLSLSAIIEKPRNEREKIVIQSFSMVISFMSFMIVVLSQFWGSYERYSSCYNNPIYYHHKSYDIDDALGVITSIWTI